MAAEEFVPYAEHEFTHRGITQRIEALEKRVESLETGLRVLSVEDASIRERLDMLLTIVRDMKEGMDKKFDRMEMEMKEFRSRPGRLWDGFVLAVVSAGIGATATLVMQMILRR